MTTKVGTMNGQERKTLSSQLDRFDQILDTLGEGLNEAVATTVEKAVELAVRQAVGHTVAQAVHEAVQAVLAEVLTNTDLCAVLRDVAPVAPAQPAAAAGQTRGVCNRVSRWLKGGLGGLRNACGSVVGQLARVKPMARAARNLVHHFRAPLLAACGVGVVIGLAAYCAGPWLGAAAGWVGGFFATLAVQARNSLRGLLLTASSE